MAGSLPLQRNLAAAAVIALLAVAAAHLPPWSLPGRGDRALYDVWMTLSAPEPPDDIVLIELDDPAWLAALVNLAERQAAALLISTLQQPVLPDEAVLGPTAVSLSGAPLLRPTGWSTGGHLWLRPDVDGVVRHDQPVIEATTPIPSLPFAAVSRLSASIDPVGTAIHPVPAIDDAGRRWLRFYKRGSFPELVPQQLGSQPALLHGKIIVAGRGEPTHRTPVGVMSTRELVAHVLAGYRQNEAVLAGWLNDAAAWAVAALALAFATLRARRPGAAVVVGLAALLVGSFVAFRFANMWLPAAGPALWLVGTAAIIAARRPTARHREPAAQARRAGQARSEQPVDIRRTEAASAVAPVLGRYELLDEIGRGAAGRVYLARDPKINRLVAIKAIDLTASADEEEIAELSARFLREAETAGRLSHPNIVTIFDVGETDGVAYIAMELVEGRRLSEHVTPDTLLPVPLVLELIACAADALDYAHRQNVVHRDIKPANIMYDFASGTLKITDFGIARLIDVSRTRTGIVLGTPSFMSPEQLEGENVNGHTDLFALGVSLYQLLTGHLPFRGTSMTELMFVIANEPHPPLTAVRKDLPERLNVILDTALAKRPADRFKSGAEMARALRQPD